MAHFAGKRLAFDAWNILYQFLSSIRGPDGTPLTDREGRITSHLQGLLNRTGALVEAGVKPVFVFDGPPHRLKSETLAQRSARKEKAQAEHDAAKAVGDTETMRVKAQQTSRLTPPMVDTARELLEALGIPTLQAPGEGEAQASWMAQQGIVQGVVSQDYDAVLFGAPVLVRNLGVGGRRKLPGKMVWVDAPPEEVPLGDSLAHAACPDTCPVRGTEAPVTGPVEHHGITREQLVDAALLVGTDFHPGVKGIGAKKAIALIREAGSLDALLARLGTSPPKSAVERYIVEQREGLDVRDEVRRIFLEPAHVETATDFTVRPPNAERVKEIMVERHGFSAERVTAALGKYQAARGKQAQQRLF
jgi:flap endonuclease-1